MSKFLQAGWATSYYEKDFGYLGHYFVFFEKWGGMWHRQNWRQKNTILFMILTHSFTIMIILPLGA